MLSGVVRAPSHDFMGNDQVLNNTDKLKRGDYLLYDGECPVCSRFVLWTNIRNKHPGIALLDARHLPELVDALRTEGIEINNTMLLHVDGRRFVGAAAITKISTYMPRSTFPQRILKALTSSQRLIQPIYPALVLGRKFLLALLGRQLIT